MPANTSPIFGVVPRASGVVVGTQNTKSDGTGTIATDLWLAFTAGAFGSFLQKLILIPTSSVAATATAATVLRAFLSSVTSGATATTNTRLFKEVSAGVQTADHSLNAILEIDIPLGFAIPAGSTLLVSTHIANAANTAWVATVIGSDY